MHGFNDDLRLWCDLRRVQGTGGLGFRILGLGFRVQGLGTSRVRWGRGRGGGAGHLERFGV